MKYVILMMWTMIHLVSLGYAQQYLKNGDIIFVADNQSAFAQSINSATNKEHGYNYNHVALLQIQDNDSFVWHATTKYGVVKQSFESFKLLHPMSNIDIYRLEDLSKLSDAEINQLFSSNAKHLGKGYNYSFIPNDTSYYCSEFVLELMGSFLRYNLIPMNFKDLKTGIMPTFWIEYYQKLGIQIPQDILGSNPNDLAKQSSAVYQFRLQ